jgi:5-deoxy-glucuronate isomerase
MIPEPLDVAFEGVAEVLLWPDHGARLGVAELTAPCEVTTGAAVAWLLVQSGTGEIDLGVDRADVAERANVFDEPGWSALIAPGDAARVTGDIQAIVIWTPTEREVVTAITPPLTIATEDRGAGTSVRRVRTYVPRGPLICGETLNPPGGWSSWPPHRHDHEEVYVYRFRPDHGFGVAAAYGGEGGDAPRIVRDGAVQRIASGYHPVVAAPGYEMYYLWALAGNDDELVPELDPIHEGSA